MFNRYLLTILNIIFGLIIGVFLFSISFVNIENIYQMNFLNIYSFAYFLFLFLSIAGIFFLRFIKIKNNVLREEIEYTIKSLLFLAILLIPSVFMVHNFMFEYINESNLYLRAYGKIAFLYFALALLISPVLKFIKNNSLRENLILSRKIFGLLSFVFFLKHGFEYFAIEYIYQVKYSTDMSYLGYIYKNLLVRYDALSGVIAGFLMLILGLTSNKISIKILSGKGWKLIQSLVYPAFLLSIIHIAFASRFDNFYIFLALLVVGVRTISYISNKSDKTNKTTTKYICVPCGYIYDENLGDPDSGIEPGTKFEDISDDWYCPVCGVSKSDFEPYYDENNTVFGGYLGEVVSYNMLTYDVLELGLKLDSDVNVLRGQYAILTLNDFDGDFNRAYSIVKSENNILTFGIKLKDTGRGGRKLKELKLGNTIKVKGIYGEFVLKDTTKPKVFIATGTGLSPIMNMVSGDLKSDKNDLFFGVKSKNDLFYIDDLKSIKNLEPHIYLSREKVEGFNYGRIDLSKYDFDLNTEFYICGNPGLVKVILEYLKSAGFKNIYSEKF